MLEEAGFGLNLTGFVLNIYSILSSIKTRKKDADRISDIKDYFNKLVVLDSVLHHAKTIHNAIENYFSYSKEDRDLLNKYFLNRKEHDNEIQNILDKLILNNNYLPKLIKTIKEIDWFDIGENTNNRNTKEFDNLTDEFKTNLKKIASYYPELKEQIKSLAELFEKISIDYQENNIILFIEEFETKISDLDKEIRKLLSSSDNVILSYSIVTNYLHVEAKKIMEGF